MSSPALNKSRCRRCMAAAAGAHATWGQPSSGSPPPPVHLPPHLCSLAVCPITWCTTATSPLSWSSKRESPPRHEKGARCTARGATLRCGQCGAAPCAGLAPLRRSSQNLAA